jgi:hypothetical protein
MFPLSAGEVAGRPKQKPDEARRRWLSCTRDLGQAGAAQGEESQNAKRKMQNAKQENASSHFDFFILRFAFRVLPWMPSINDSLAAAAASEYLSPSHRGSRS